MSKIDRIEAMLRMEEQTPEKDDAGICIPKGLDSAIRAKAFNECLKVLKDGNDAE